MDEALTPTSLSNGDKIYLSGITARGNRGDISEQTREVLTILDIRLAEAETDRTSLLTVHIWLKDMIMFQEMTAAWNNWIGTDDPPSRSCVSGEPMPAHALLEVVATATRPQSSHKNRPIERFGLVRGEGRPTMCLGLAHHDWFTVCTLAPNYKEDISSQTKQILQVFDKFLTQAGTDKSKILTMEIWLKHMTDIAAVNDVLLSWLDPGALPSTSCVRADMADPEMLIEIRITTAR